MHNGFAIAISWPETLCKEPGAWYDLPFRWIGFNKNYYYQLGHAAVVLVEASSGNSHYFDFGRYHAPHGYGRARSAKTDHELEVKTPASINKDRLTITNVQEILLELTNSEATHGTGIGYASAVPVNVDKSLQFAYDFQNKGFFKYGPFTYGGSNCSRFVNDVITAGNPPLLANIMLRCPIMLTPTTNWNVLATGAKTYSTRIKEASTITKQEETIINA